MFRRYENPELSNRNDRNRPKVKSKHNLNLSQLQGFQNLSAKVKLDSMASQVVSKTSILLGRCVPCLKQNASKFKVKKLELDTNLLMYFGKEDYVYAFDPKKICKTGDIVLIEELPEKMTRLITHSVKKVVYPLGDITDPLSGKKVVAGKYRDYIEAVNKVYGEEKGAFKYDTAPPRGWQEDKKDFTHAETYIKYHESGEEDPYAV